MENNVATESPTKKLLGILSISVLPGILFDYFFYHKMPGIAFPVYMAIMVAGIALVTEGFKKHRASKNIWIAVPVLFFASLVAVRDNESLTALNILTSVFCLFLLIDSLSGKKITSFQLKDYIS